MHKILVVCPWREWELVQGQVAPQTRNSVAWIEASKVIEEVSNSAEKNELIPLVVIYDNGELPFLAKGLETLGVESFLVSNLRKGIQDAWAYLPHDTKPAEPPAKLTGDFRVDWR